MLDKRLHSKTPCVLATIYN